MNDQAWLQRVERDLSAESRRSQESSSLFRCQLEVQPDHLVPAHLLQPAQVGRNLSLNPRTHWTREELPKDTSVPGQFSQDGNIVRIEDAATHRVDPFWMDDSTWQLLERVRAGGANPEECFTRALLTALGGAGVLVEAGHQEQRLQDWDTARARYSFHFEQRGFVPLHGLLHPFHISALRRYYRHQIRSGALRFGDPQSERRFVSHNDSVARYFHRQLTPVVSAIVGEAVKPSYVYVASYQEGADLEKHTDREQCEFSITYCLDFSPEPVSDTGWPLVLHFPEGTTSIYQRLGDGLLYRGRQIPHSRFPLGRGKTSTSMFFHYVREDFQGRLD